MVISTRTMAELGVFRRDRNSSGGAYPYGVAVYRRRGRATFALVPTCRHVTSVLARTATVSWTTVRSRTRGKSDDHVGEPARPARSVACGVRGDCIVYPTEGSRVRALRFRYSSSRLVDGLRRAEVRIWDRGSSRISCSACVDPEYGSTAAAGRSSISASSSVTIPCRPRTIVAGQGRKACTHHVDPDGRRVYLLGKSPRDGPIVDRRGPRAR